MKLAAAFLSIPFILASAVPARAQGDGGNHELTIGAGAMYRPSYEGSDDYIAGPIGFVRGKLSGFSFYTRGTALYVNLVRDPKGAGYRIEAGPMLNVRLDRTSSIKDDRVRALGEIQTAVETGAFVGLTKNGLFHGYDWMSFRLDVSHDVTGIHRSTIISPGIEYATPLSPTFLVGIGVSAEHVGDGYARTYFSVSPEGAAASGLSPYDADGGFKNVRGSILLTQSLSGDLRRGLALFGLGSYSRLLGDFARSPIVSDAGNRNQFFVAGGLAHTF